MAHCLRIKTVMTTLGSDIDRKKSLLRGAASLFDLSGTGLLPEVHFGSIHTDKAALRGDLELFGEDFWIVVHKEIKRLKEQTDGGKQ